MGSIRRGLSAWWAGRGEWRLGRGGRRFRRAVIVLASLMGLVCLVVAGLNLWVVRSTTGRIVDEASQARERFGSGYDAILVLGAGITPDGKPSVTLTNRLATAVELYQAGLAPVVLLTGDNSRLDYNEVEVMRQYMVDAGVPAGDVYRDFAGFSTWESIYRAREVFQARRLVIVTQRYHLYRALFGADRLGLDAVGVAAERWKGFDLGQDIRETAARTKEPLATLFGRKPTFLGPVIELIPSQATRPEAGPTVG
ncbi:MAG: YdcF family protein [Micrococcales bacterium]|nr:YdcF family protein [Micrococcales bacterium]